MMLLAMGVLFVLLLLIFAFGMVYRAGVAGPV